MKSRTIAMGALLALPLLAAPTLLWPSGARASESEKVEPFKRMTVAELESKMKEARAGKLDLHIFDNNSKDRWSQGHVPGAVWVQYDEVQAGMLPADKNATLVFYCANEHCQACHAGADSAVKLGYKNVYILPAGIMGWEKAKKPTEKG